MNYSWSGGDIHGVGAFSSPQFTASSLSLFPSLRLSVSVCWPALLAALTDGRTQGRSNSWSGLHDQRRRRRRTHRAAAAAAASGDGGDADAAAVPGARSSQCVYQHWPHQPANLPAESAAANYWRWRNWFLPTTTRGVVLRVRSSHKTNLYIAAAAAAATTTLDWSVQSVCAVSVRLTGWAAQTSERRDGH